MSDAPGDKELFPVLTLFGLVAYFLYPLTQNHFTTLMQEYGKKEI